MPEPVKRLVFSALEAQAYGRELRVYSVDAPDGTRSFLFETKWSGFSPQTVLISKADMDRLKDYAH